MSELAAFVVVVVRRELCVCVELCCCVCDSVVLDDSFFEFVVCALFLAFLHT